jgi:hypothetical protein
MNPLRFDFGLAQNRQQHRRENDDDGNHHEQLDQCESTPWNRGKSCAGRDPDNYPPTKLNWSNHGLVTS